jgi:asparagine synthase (glutamine-hydrolysing)
MLGCLRHRGPDEAGLHLSASGRTALGHTRLAIVDPREGQQPLETRSGTCVVSNGEIYNHVALRRGIDSGELASGTDAAVIGPLYEAHGWGFVEALDGMFAFVVSASTGELLAGRDRLGIKPLYRACAGADVAFVSELKLLDASRWESIDAVPPGHVWVGDELRRYWEFPDPVVAGPTGDAAVARWSRELREVLEAAVVKRLMSDVPLGTFLSGGLDSSIITALAARHHPGISTFALGFDGSADLEAARRVAAHLGTTHHEIVVGNDEPERVLAEVVVHLESWDRDLVRSAIPTYLVARFAAGELAVVLTGEGADELFAGYRYHRHYADEPATLQRELHRSVAAMHDSNLQRVDRMTMAHSLEARVPFLDPDVVEVAMQIPAELKLRRSPDGRLVEKWILRHAFADLLPDEIVWRTKSQFDEGSGTLERLPALAQAAMDGSVPDEPEARLRDVEEAWYFEQARTGLPDWHTVRANTSVWEEDRLPVAAPSAPRPRCGIRD